MKKLHTLLFLLTMTTVSIAQSYIDLGSQSLIRGDENRQFLPTGFSGPTKIQIFYTNAQLLQYGLSPGDEIIGLEWYVDTDNSPVASVFDLYMNDDYTGSTLPSGETFADVPMTLVGSNLVDDFQGTGWHSVTLDNPFIWDGTDNFIIQNCKTAGDGQGDSDELGVVGTPQLHMQSGYFNVPCSSTASTIPSYSYIPQIRLLVISPEPTCDAPTNVQHTLQSPAKCAITWDAMPNATKYDILYRVKGTTDWTRRGALNNYLTLRYLAPNTIYQYRVRPYCGSWDFANASDRKEFNTANIPMARESSTGFETAITSITPNPAHDVLNVQFSTETTSDVTFSVVDMMGKVVYQNNIGNVEGMQTEEIDVSHLGGGYYMVVMQSAETRIVKKFVVAK